MDEEEGTCGGTRARGRATERKRETKKRGGTREAMENGKRAALEIVSGGKKLNVWSGARACMPRLSSLTKLGGALVGDPCVPQPAPTPSSHCWGVGERVDEEEGACWGMRATGGGTERTRETKERVGTREASGKRKKNNI